MSVGPALRPVSLPTRRSYNVRMQWSQIRTQLRALVSPRLRKRVDFHLTNYRKHGSRSHEVWITVDGQKVFSASYCDYMISENVLQRRRGIRTWAEGKEGKEAHDVLTRAEIHDASITVYAFREYLDTNPQDALVSSDPVLRALAIVDRRIGRRTFRKLKIKKTEHSLVRAFYSLRLKAEESLAETTVT
jgi:hypothetical protein